MRWNGWPGSPGYTNFHLMQPELDTTLALRDAAATRVRNFFQAFINYIPAPVTITYPSEMEVFDTTTGELLRTEPITGLSATVCGGTGNWSAAAGACINWSTSLVVNNRKLRGRTFIVPLASSVFSTDGTLSDSPRGNMLIAAQALISEQNNFVLGIWRKPSATVPTGSAAQVASASINDKTAVLRSRRD